MSERVATFLNYLNEKAAEWPYTEQTPRPNLAAPGLISKGTKNFSPEEVELHKQQTATVRGFMRDTAPKSGNVTAMFDRLKPGEKKAGKEWYLNAHNATKVISGHTGLTHHAVVGMTAALSPQTDWHENLRNALHSAVTRMPLGGAGRSHAPVSQGGRNKGHNPINAMASDSSYKNIHNMMSDPIFHKHDASHAEISGFLQRHLGDVKMGHFGHNIMFPKHGSTKPGDQKYVDTSNPGKQFVAADRHATSNTIVKPHEKGLNDYELSEAGLDAKHHYSKVVNAHVDAAKHISEKTGQQWLPHEVQAVTWSPRQSANEMLRDGGARHAAAAEAAKDRLHRHIDTMTRITGQNFHDIVPHLPVTGYGQDVGSFQKKTRVKKAK